MDETVTCPGCQAQLVLPVMAAGQTAQCPRCQRVFEPFGQRAAPPRQSPAPESHRTEVPEYHDEFRVPQRRIASGALVGVWFGYFTMLALAVWSLAFLARAYAEYDIERHDPRFMHRLEWKFTVEFWQAVISWVALPCFALWLFLASRNAAMLGASGLSLQPSTVLLAFFCCPILNVILIYINLQEVWRASDPRKIERWDAWRSVGPSALIRVWGLSMLFAAPLLFLVNSSRGDVSFTIGLLSLSLAISSALMIAIIYVIQARQQERYIRLYEDPD